MKKSTNFSILFSSCWHLFYSDNFIGFVVPSLDTHAKRKTANFLFVKRNVEIFYIINSAEVSMSDFSKIAEDLLWVVSRKYVPTFRVTRWNFFAWTRQRHSRFETFFSRNDEKLKEKKSSENETKKEKNKRKNCFFLFRQQTCDLAFSKLISFRKKNSHAHCWEKTNRRKFNADHRFEHPFSSFLIQQIIALFISGFDYIRT